VSPALPVTGPPIDWSRIDTIVIHYTASKDCPEGDDRQAYGAFLRAMQRDYTTNRGYSLGYSVAVATVGESWGIRGDDLKPAATKDHNDHTFAILVTVDGDAEASPAAVVEVRRLVAEAEQRAGRTLKIVGHGELGATACPGAGLRRQIVADVFRPVAPPPPPPPSPSTEQHRMFVIVGNADNRNDPRRWFYDGFRCRHITEQDFNEARILGWLHPSFNTLSAPFWKPSAWITALGG
jgi:hypothetical protein